MLYSDDIKVADQVAMDAPHFAQVTFLLDKVDSVSNALRGWRAEYL